MLSLLSRKRVRLEGELAAPAHESSARMSLGISPMVLADGSGGSPSLGRPGLPLGQLAGRGLAARVPGVISRLPTLSLPPSSWAACLRVSPSLPLVKFGNRY